MLKINFAPDAKEADIRLLLVPVQGELAGGPGQLGDYYLRVPAGKEAAALAKVQGRTRSCRPPRWRRACRRGSKPPWPRCRHRRLLLRCALGAAALPFGAPRLQRPAARQRRRIAHRPGDRQRRLPHRTAEEPAPTTPAPSRRALSSLGYDVTLRENTPLPRPDRVAA